MSKYWIVCMDCGRTVNKVNKDGECPKCVQEKERINTRRMRSDITRLNNLLSFYENHIITKYLDRKNPSKDMKVISYAEEVRSAIRLIKSNL